MNISSNVNVYLGQICNKETTKKNIWMLDFRIRHEVDDIYTLLGSPITYQSHL